MKMKPTRIPLEKKSINFKAIQMSQQNQCYENCERWITKNYLSKC